MVHGVHCRSPRVICFNDSTKVMYIRKCQGNVSPQNFACTRESYPTLHERYNLVTSRLLICATVCIYSAYFTGHFDQKLCSILWALRSETVFDSLAVALFEAFHGSLQTSPAVMLSLVKQNTNAFVRLRIIDSASVAMCPTWLKII